MLADFDDKRDAALVVTSNQDVEEILGMARYDADPATGLAEIALAVRDEWQGRGLGTALFVRLIGLARAQGVRGFTAQVLASNGRMLRLFKASGLPIKDSFECGVHELTMSLEAEPSAASASGNAVRHAPPAPLTPR